MYQGSVLLGGRFFNAETTIQCQAPLFDISGVWCTPQRPSCSLGDRSKLSGRPRGEETVGSFSSLFKQRLTASQQNVMGIVPMT